MSPEYTLDGQQARSADYDTTRPSYAPPSGDQNGDHQTATQSGGGTNIAFSGDTSAKTDMGGGGGSGGGGSGGGAGGYSLGASFATGPLQSSTGLSGSIKNDNSGASINFGNKVFSPYGSASGGTSSAGLSTTALIGIAAALLIAGVVVYALSKGK